MYHGFVVFSISRANRGDEKIFVAAGKNSNSPPKKARISKHKNLCRRVWNLSPLKNDGRPIIIIKNSLSG
jgi:hypothetical protein